MGGGVRGRGRRGGGRGALVPAALAALAALAGGAGLARGGTSARAAGGGFPVLDSPYEVSLEAKLEFERNGVIKLKDLVPEIDQYARALRFGFTVGTLEYVRAEAARLECSTAFLDRMNTPDVGARTPDSDEEMAAAHEKALASMLALEECAEALGSVEYLKYFQALNLLRFNPDLENWVRNSRVASAVSQLLDTPVRLYQDGYFRKGDKKDKKSATLRIPTMVHQDLSLVPVRTDRFATAWCPLLPLDKDAPGATPLMFVRGSQRNQDWKLSANAYRDVRTLIGDVMKENAKRLEKSDPAALMKYFEAVSHPRRGFTPWMQYGKGPAVKHLDGKVYSGIEIDDSTRTVIERFCTTMLDRGTTPPYSILSEDWSKAPFGWGGNYCTASFVYRKFLLDGLLEKFPAWGKENGAWAKARKEAEEEEEEDGQQEEEEVSDDEDFDLATAQAESSETMAERHATEAAFLADVVNAEFFWVQGGGVDTYSYDVGDCTVHHGRVYHAAAGTQKGTNVLREAVTMHFIDANGLKVPEVAVESSQPNNDVKEHEDYVSFARWWDKVSDGGRLSEADDILPLAWPLPKGNASGAEGGADGDL